MQLPSLRRALSLCLRIGLALLALAFLLLLVLALQSRKQPELAPWHRLVLDHEVHAGDIDRRFTWQRYVQAEQRLFAELSSKLAAARVPGQYRYEVDSRLGGQPGQHDWNRSYESMPRDIRGGVLLLHGLSDSPYSLRHVAALYERAGFVVIAPRMPGHGTVPAGLLQVRWQDWSAVVRIAARELQARVGPGKPLHVVGYSNGAALALDYAMEVAGADATTLPRVDRLILLSPMVGVGRSAGLARLLPVFGGLAYFEKSRWMDILPEFNPYKYNSFPLNAAVQSHLLTTHVRAGVLRLKARRRLDRLPPILAFQSVLDNTVSTSDVVHALFDQLPANGSELVLFDLNRAHLLAPMLTPAATGFADTLHGDAPRKYRLTVVGNTRPDTLAASERSFAPGRREPSEHSLALAFPPTVYSLSHVALPFPMDDALYGLEPRADEDYGIRLGTLVLHGERDALVIKAEQLMRLNCNPFFSYLAGRIDREIETDGPAAP